MKSFDLIQINLSAQAYNVITLFLSGNFVHMNTIKEDIE